MHHDDRPIGMFDSGVGGLSVLAEVVAQMPTEDVVYVADQRWAPYGGRSLDDVRARAVQLAGQLIDVGAKAVVVACNSASAAALTHLRETYRQTPFVGMEPAVKPAALKSTTGVIGVIATEATFQGELFASVVDRHANGARVLTAVPKGLVEMVEQGLHRSPQAAAALWEALGPMLAAGMDTLVLGCTHFPFLGDVIGDIVGAGVAVIDPAPAVARQVARVLGDAGIAAGRQNAGTIRYHTTLDPDRLATVIGTLTGVVPQVGPTRW